MQKSKHNVHWSLDKGSKKTWSCTEQKMKAKSLTYSTSIEIMSKERFPPRFAYASEREHCYPFYVRHCPLNISDSTGYIESHIIGRF